MCVLRVGLLAGNSVLVGFVHQVPLVLQDYSTSFGEKAASCTGSFT